MQNLDPLHRPLLALAGILQPCGYVGWKPLARASLTTPTRTPAAGGCTQHASSRPPGGAERVLSGFPAPDPRRAHAPGAQRSLAPAAPHVRGESGAAGCRDGGSREPRLQELQPGEPSRAGDQQDEALHGSQAPFHPRPPARAAESWVRSLPPRPPVTLRSSPRGVGWPRLGSRRSGQCTLPPGVCAGCTPRLAFSRSCPDDCFFF